MPVLSDVVVNTYGGNFTYCEISYEIENDEIFFYEMHYGHDPSPLELIDDIQEIRELMDMVPEKVIRGLKLKNILSTKS
jgi:hypothetical protein